MKYTANDFENEIAECLSLARKELNDRRNGFNGESTIEQLENFIIPDLLNLQSKIRNSDPLPANTQQERYVASFGCAFKLWGWNMQTPTTLFNALLKLNQNYRLL